MKTLRETLIDVFGAGAEVITSAPVSGGDINRAHCLTLKGGDRVFVKSNRGAPKDFFRAEAEGLQAIAETGAIRVPRVLGIGAEEGLGDFLLLEWVEAAPRARDCWERFGRALAAMHRAAARVPGGKYGFTRDNYIGARSQINAPSARWVDFFRDCRLAPQIKDAHRWFEAGDRRRIEGLMARLEEWLIEPPAPSLLHGDLWSGNFIIGGAGQAWLIDPAAYVGHAEADLAMTELFGGFPRAFYDAYWEVNPLQPGYERRRDLYNLYHLLNHLNLFGDGYLSAVRHTIRAYAGA